MSNVKNAKPVEILLVEDNPGDALLTKRFLEKSKICNNFHVAEDGFEAMAFLQRIGKYKDAPLPDLILLDLNLPGKDGREVLAEVKSDKNLCSIPIIIFTSSEAEEDIAKSYNLHANCYITKPVDFEQFRKVLTVLEDFWFMVVKLPPHGK
jgi:two-component system response regulator